MPRYNPERIVEQRLCQNNVDAMKILESLSDSALVKIKELGVSLSEQASFILAQRLETANNENEP